MKTIETLNENQNLRNQMANTICFSVFLSLGANFIVTGLSLHEKIFAIVGLVIIPAILLFWVFTHIRYLNKEILITGLILYNETKNSFEEIPDYEISGNMNRYFYSACKENKAIEKNMKGKSLVDFKQEEKFKIRYNKKHEPTKIVHELIEYCFLQKLMLILCDFNNTTDSQDIISYPRENFLSLLSKNRFLSLFTEPMNNRESFCDDEYTENVVMAYSNGCMYEKLEIYLPKKSKIEKKDNSVIIKTKAANIVIKTSFTGSSICIDSLFENYYLNNLEYSDYSFDVSIELKWKIISLINRKLKKNYAWIDSFINEAQHYADYDVFLEDINWKTIKANFIIHDTKKKNRLLNIIKSKVITPALECTSLSEKTKNSIKEIYNHLENQETSGEIAEFFKNVEKNKEEKDLIKDFEQNKLESFEAIKNLVIQEYYS